jgi:hypothetical protein
MEHWVIIIVLTSGLALPLSDFTSELDCRAGLEEMTFTNGAWGGCMKVDDALLSDREKRGRAPLRFKRKVRQ